MFELLAGIALAAFLFSAFLWSIYRSVMTKGRARQVNIFLGIFTLLGLIAISNTWQILALSAGVPLAILSLVAIWYDKGWSKLLPLVQLLFGIALILGLPWAAA